MCLSEADEDSMDEPLKKGLGVQRLAEGWRAGASGTLRRDEVNITKIGESWAQLSCASWS